MEVDEIRRKVAQEQLDQLNKITDNVNVALQEEMQQLDLSKIHSYKFSMKDKFESKVSVRQSVTCMQYFQGKFIFGDKSGALYIHDKQKVQAKVSGQNALRKNCQHPIIVKASKDKRRDGYEKGHFGAVYAIAVNESLIISGGRDGIINVRDHTLHSLYTLVTYGVVYALNFVEGNMLVAAVDDKLQVFDLDSRMFLRELFGNTDYITSLSINKHESNLVLAGSIDTSVRAFNIEKQNHYIFTVSQKVNSVGMLNNFFFLAAGDKALQVVSKRQRKPIFSLANSEILKTTESYAQGQLQLCAVDQCDIFAVFARKTLIIYRFNEEAAPQSASAVPECLIELFRGEIQDGFVNSCQMVKENGNLILSYCIGREPRVNRMEVSQNGDWIGCVVIGNDGKERAAVSKRFAK